MIGMGGDRFGGPSFYFLSSDDLFHQLNVLGFNLSAERVADLLRVWSQDARLVQRLKAVEEHLSGDSASDSDRLRHARVAVGITKQLKSGCNGFLSRELATGRIGCGLDKAGGTCL